MIGAEEAALLTQQASIRNLQSASNPPLGAQREQGTGCGAITLPTMDIAVYCATSKPRPHAIGGHGTVVTGVGSGSDTLLGTASISFLISLEVNELSCGTAGEGYLGEG